MVRGNPVILATRSFATQGEATAFFKEMLARYRVGQHIDTADAFDLAGLLERHTEFKQKVGCGVDHFSKMMTKEGTPCFRIHRTDGTGTDFSYRHCIRPQPSRKQEVSQAFRRVVRFDLYKARDSFFAESHWEPIRTRRRSEGRLVAQGIRAPEATHSSRRTVELRSALSSPRSWDRDLATPRRYSPARRSSLPSAPARRLRPERDRGMPLTTAPAGHVQDGQLRSDALTAAATVSG
jgi:hypothetical protein